jgi:flagellar biosynthesis/type III secretory pathway protein FliH
MNQTGTDSVESPAPWKVKLPLKGHGRITGAVVAHPLEGKLAALTEGHRQEVEQVRGDAYEQGYRAGLAEGEKKLAEARSRFEDYEVRILEEIRQSVPGFLEEAVPALTELAFEVAAKFVDRKAVDTTWLEEEISGGIAKLTDNSGVEVRMNQSDLEMLSKAGAGILERTDDAGERIPFKASSQVESGGFVLQCRMGTMDFTRETRFRRIRQLMEEMK